MKRFLLAVAASSVAFAAPLLVPAGLNPGDPYRLIFVTSGSRDALSANIGDYNAFVNTAANAPTSILQSLGTTWFAVASTQAVSAAVNIGGSSSIPIYRPDGVLVANGTADLFDASIASGISLTEQNTNYSYIVWTGTQSDGTQYGGLFPLGAVFSAVGVSFLTNISWIADTYTTPEQNFALYGISSTLFAPDAVPEPSALLTTLSALATLSLLCRRNVLNRNKR